MDPQKKQPEKNAQDWVRQLRFSNDVNVSTVGVDTDRVTPQLMLASSKKLLNISRGQEQGDQKDSLRYQTFYGPVEYFAQRIQKDGGSVARSMLWKATHKGNVDFIGSGSLEPHISSVFHQLNLSQFVDNSSPMEGVDAAMKVTRIGEGGIKSGDSAPIEMRLVQPSYYGYIGSTRTAQRNPGLTGYMTKNVLRGTDGKLYQRMLNMKTGKLELVSSQKAAASIVTTDEYLDTDDKYVYAMGGPKGVRIVKKSDVDYILPNSDDAYSLAANYVPMFSGVKAMRLLMGCHHPNTPILIVDQYGCTDIVPAKRLGRVQGTFYVVGCDNKGNDALYKVRSVVPRVPAKGSSFIKVVLSSGRVLTTSDCHRWSIYKDDKFQLLYADDLTEGMKVPRSLFSSVPVRNTTAMGVPVDEDICVLLGRICASLNKNLFTYRFTYSPEDKQQIKSALDKLKVLKYIFYTSKGQHMVSIKDPVFLDWMEEHIGFTDERKRIPKCILSLGKGLTSVFLASFFSNLTQVAQDCIGDSWLLDLPNGQMRDALAFLLSKIYTDTKFRDSNKQGKVHRALQLIPAQTQVGDICLETIVSVTKVAPPATMIDIDCDDNVYATANGIITHNSKYGSQAIPLKQRQAPLVRALDSQSGQDMPTRIGRFLGTQWAPKPGMVKAVRKDRIDMLYDDGTTGSVYLYENFPANAKGWLTNYVKVKAGDKVGKGQLLASSNYTDDKGVAATGRNLRIGYMSFHGGTYEDACIVSQSAAKKMSSTVMYKTGMDKDKSIRTSRSLYNTWKPGAFSKQQMQKLDDNGVVQVGQVLNPGDPMILGIRTTEPSPGTLGKRILTDVTQKWEHHSPGVVTDVVNTRSGIKVYATVDLPLQVGSKISGFQGNKGVCYSADTQVLTKDGWKYFKDLTQIDQVATLDIDGTAKFQVPSALQTFSYQGQMYGYRNRYLSWLVTPDHMMWACSRYDHQTNREAFKRVPAHEVWGNRYAHKVCAQFQQGQQPQFFQVPAQLRADGRQPKDPNHTWKTQDMAAFLGIYLAQGHLDKGEGRYYIKITQQRDLTDPDSGIRCDRIQSLLDRMGFKVNRDGNHYTFFNKALHMYLQQFGNSRDKFVPEQVFGWSHRLQQIFLDWFYMGDGQKCQQKHRIGRIRVISKQLVQDLQRLYILNGYQAITHEYKDRIREYKGQKRTYSRLYGVSIFKNTRRQSKPRQHNNDAFPGYYKQLYKGKVYCCTVSTGVIMVQRNGCPMWCGNCAQILPDEKMPRDSKGRPLQLLFDPLGIVSRTNPSQLMQAGLGKVAAKTGKPIVMPQFMPKGQSRIQYVKKIMKQNNVPWKEDVYDPQSGRTVKNVFTGVAYFMPLKHYAEAKMSARGTAGYSQDETPSRGGYQGCFIEGQKIITIHGEKQIGGICQKRIPEYVMSWDDNRKEWVWRQITDWFIKRAKVQDILNIFTQNSLSMHGGKCSVKHTCSSYPTKNHKMYMADGSIKLAGELKVGQYLAGVGTVYTQDQKQALLGTLMGDASRDNRGGIQCMHSSKQVEYIKYKRSIFAAVGASRVSVQRPVVRDFIKKTGQIQHIQSKAVTVNLPKCFWVQKALEMCYDSFGKKHLTVPVLQGMGQFGFCLWFLDDGSIHNHAKKKGSVSPQARLATHNFTVQEVKSAAKWLQANILHVEGGTSITIYKGKKGQDQPCLNFRTQASWQIMRIIAKHVPYDVIPKSKKTLRDYCQKVQKTTPSLKHDFNSKLGIVPIKIKQIIPYRHTKTAATQLNVYDFTVDETHNYCLSGGIKVSNSKSLGNLETSALVGHDAFNFLIEDAKLIRGQSNADFWRSIRTGDIPVVPGQPLVHKKFFNHLKASGLNVKRTTQGMSIFALSNKDVQQMAGPRQLKSTDTYEHKNFTPIAGGLFGTDVFGEQGNNWGYIQLDSPLPNPVMEQPLARLLNITDTQFQNIIEGKQTVNGMSNASDMKKVLAGMDLQAETQKALAQMKDARPSKKDAALKRYVAIARMRDSGLSPDEYMLDRIPVLPPKFRPITSHGDLTMVADSNYLYAQLLNARDDMRQAKTAGLPQDMLQQAQAGIYRKWKELTGLHDPADVKLKNKNVKGLLKWALGSSPKHSAFARKVLGSVVDTVGRGVVVPSTKIKLNEVGMPIEMAWDVYEPFVVRKMVQRNYSPVEAMKMVKRRDPGAMDALKDAMSERPVVMNRAPSLHKLSLMGFQPRLVKGNSILVNPSIVVPFGMDHDGDSVLNTTEIMVDQKTLEAIFEKSRKRKFAFFENLCILSSDEQNQSSKEATQERNQTMISKDNKINLVNVTCSLEDIPVKPGTEVKKSETVTEWDVDGIVKVNTVDPTTGEIVTANMTKVSKHTGLKMFDCVLDVSGAYSHVVTASEDHSLITLDPATIELKKTRPEEAVGAVVPRTMNSRINDHDKCVGYIKLGKTYQLDYNMGVFLGMMIGDGWVSSEGQVHIACCDPSLQRYITDLCSPEKSDVFTKQAKLYMYEADPARFSQKDRGRFSIYMDADDRWSLKKKIGSGAYSKQIPVECLMASRTHMIGVLCGLLATDGHIGLSKTASKKASIKNIAFHTTSCILRDGIQHLALNLGVRTRVNPYMGPNSKVTCYEIGFCLEDVAKLKAAHPKTLVIPVDYKEEALKEICNSVREAKATSYDIVPFPRGLFCEYSYADVTNIAKDTVIAARMKGYIKRSVAKKIADHMEQNVDWDSYYQKPGLAKKDRTNHTPEQAKELVRKWIDIVRNDNIGWEVVKSVTPSTVTEGWDCTVPGPYTFTLSTGTVVQDTVNLHVPVSKAGIKDVRQKMMPQQNLISMRKKKILYAPQKAYAQGLYVATRMDDKQPVQTFQNIKEAKQAYAKGTIDVDTPIVIKE